MYHSDMPIKTRDHDLLGRAPFAHNLAKTIIRYDTDDSLCIGLCGKWGSGKTSVVNMLVNEIENFPIARDATPIIIRFEPWNFTNTDQLLKQFFIRLASVLISKADQNTSELIEKIASYSEAMFELVDLIPHAGGALASLGKKVLPKAADKLNKGIKGKDITAQKEVIEEALL